ncbi:MAG: hypothetical protein EXR29_09740 [Betaproteobacteria bacterium]|nr:hypothetical protein [Betaproteobacteria bacterium]
MNMTADEPSPQRRLITTRAEYQEAIDLLLPMAQLELRVFDPDLSDLRLHVPERVAVLRDFLSRGRNNRLYIAVHRTEFIEQRAPRLLTLLGLFAANIFIQRTMGDAARVQDCFILCDEAHLVRRMVAAQPRGVILTDDLIEGAKMRDRFDQIWESAEPGVSANTSGL